MVHLFACFSAVLSHIFAPIVASERICHTDSGTSYGAKGITAYAESNHGPDGALFLDPFFKIDLENLENLRILDVGCGAAPWAIYAAKNGGNVFAIDIQDEMIQVARRAIHEANVDDKVSLLKGDVAELSFQSGFFDKCISICVGCNLPQDSFEKHVMECYRTLKNNGTAIFGAPTSLDVVFTNGSSSHSETIQHIQSVLTKLPDDPEPNQIFEQLTCLREVLSATFIIQDHRLILVTNVSDLKEGCNIWRKLPNLVVPNRFYSKEYYVQTFKKYGFSIQNTDMPHFKNEEERVIYNETVPEQAQIGSEYVAHPPFVIYHLKK